MALLAAFGDLSCCEFAKLNNEVAGIIQRVPAIEATHQLAHGPGNALEFFKLLHRAVKHPQCFRQTSRSIRGCDQYFLRAPRIESVPAFFGFRSRRLQAAPELLESLEEIFAIFSGRDAMRFATSARIGWG
jgi:hypothetical protein